MTVRVDVSTITYVKLTPATRSRTKRSIICCTATSLTGSSRPKRVASLSDRRSTSGPRSDGVGSRSVIARAVRVGSSSRQFDTVIKVGSLIAIVAARNLHDGRVADLEQL